MPPPHSQKQSLLYRTDSGNNLSIRVFYGDAIHTGDPISGMVTDEKVSHSVPFVHSAISKHLSSETIVRW